MSENGDNSNGAGKVINFLEARRQLIEEHGTSARGARSPLLEPIRGVLGSPDIAPLFETFVYHPEQNFDLIRNLTENHGIEASGNKIFQALAHIGVERFGEEACKQYSVDLWEQSVELVRAGAGLAIAAGDWMSAERLWLQLEERAVESGAPNPTLQQQVLFELAGLLIKRGEFEGSIEFYLLCEELALNAEDHERFAIIQLQLGIAHLEHGDPGEALNRFERTIELSDAGRDADRIANAELGAGLALVDLGRTDESIGRIECALDTADPADSPNICIAASHHLARILSGISRYGEAIERLLAAIRLAEQIDDIEVRIPLLHDMFDACKASGRWGELQLEVQNAQDRVHETEQFHFLGPLLVLSAKSHAERGLLHLALHNFEEAAHLFDALEDHERLEEVKHAINHLRSIIAESKEIPPPRQT